ncbi:serine/threonine-protein kinase [Uliginosibacterium gangwonense]|uniref:serine/threonine-protein kinase n=1 Tax=Uliginosibacterium gangwonense TaxID=392736 RepID=UPI000368C8BC|nr:serine/threonine-protein kinase [Uliginosibacterium gangwonense]
MPDNLPPDNAAMGDAAALGTRPATRFDEAGHNRLPIGTRLGEFEIIGLIGEGGFGIVYLAQDHSLQRRVALKEYMPASLASRGANAAVVVRSERHQETFEIGRRSFVNEARLLAQFDHPALVKVYRFWESNGTAYMVMPYYDGRTLGEVLSALTAPPEEAWIRKILAPIIDALELIHRDNCFHRDIAPDNIILLPGDRPVLLDFGAARRVIGDMTQALTVILKPGYAPIEQYAEMPGMKQGPWTDVYALAAVVYFMIARKLPPPSVSRIVQDHYEPLATIAAGRYSDALLKGVDLCLTVRPEQRPQGMAEMRQLLNALTTATTTLAQTPAPAAAAPTYQPASQPQKESAQKSGSKLLPMLVAGAVATLALGGAGYYLIMNRTAEKPVVPTQSTPAATSLALTPASVAPAVKDVPSTPVVQNFHSLDEAMAALTRASRAEWVPSLLLPTTTTIGGEGLKLDIKAKQAGHLYLFAWDKTDDKFYRIFPNALDKNTALAADAGFALPHAGQTNWSFPIRAPEGNLQVFALFSEHPRDMANSPLATDGNFMFTTRAALDSIFTGGAGLETLIGKASCGTQACEDRYGWLSGTTEKQAGATQTQKLVIKKPDAATLVPNTATSKPNNKPKPDDSERAEREYMKQLNKDLDKMLSK